jgi:hypothetical protein
MDKDSAVLKADKILNQALTTQPNFFVPSHFQNEQKARDLAKMIATFRQELITELEKQPDC